MASTASSRRNSTAASGAGSRRGSCDSDSSFPFPPKLKKGKPVSQVKLVFMGKSMELLVPMNEDINIYDGESIDGSMEAKSKNTWVQIFDMIDLTFNNLQQQNKELKRTVNEMSSKVNKMAFHERKEESKSQPDSVKPSSAKKAPSDKPPEYNQGQVQEINKKVDSKIQRVEENILQWIDEETKTLKDTLEKDIVSIRTEVDTKNIEMNSKVQTSIADLKEEVNEKVAIIDNKLMDNIFDTTTDYIPNDTQEQSPGSVKAIMDLKNKLHQNCNTLRFLCSEPLSVQFSMWNKNEIAVPRGDDPRILCFNWINCNSGGAIDDDGVSDMHTVVIPIAGPYLLSLGCQLMGHSGGIQLKRNKREKLMDGGRSDIVDLNEDDVLEVYAEGGTKFKEVNLMGCLLRPRVFITPGTTM
eukprot:GFUD01119734.1.p1 GENE.GFUD01119734.1~~GFUD01119734.1.p1  ORF type:complete len:412 (+),score=110.39 GFUD01119734.1:28-1263(+)